MGVFYSAIAVSAFSSRTTVWEAVNNTKTICIQFWLRFSKATSDLMGFSSPQKRVTINRYDFGEVLYISCLLRDVSSGGRDRQGLPSLLLPLLLLFHWLKLGCFTWSKMLMKLQGVLHQGDSLVPGVLLATKPMLSVWVSKAKVTEKGLALQGRPHPPPRDCADH